MVMQRYGEKQQSHRWSNSGLPRVRFVPDGKWKRLKLKTGINNLGDQRYFTQRTDEYPGPGIIPSVGRSFYVGLGGVLYSSLDANSQLQ
jgi:outer membrane receptor for Fe3+-dicitrate